MSCQKNTFITLKLKFFKVWNAFFRIIHLSGNGSLLEQSSDINHGPYEYSFAESCTSYCHSVNSTVTGNFPVSYHLQNGKENSAYTLNEITLKQCFEIKMSTVKK